MANTLRSEIEYRLHLMGFDTRHVMEKIPLQALWTAVEAVESHLQQMHANWHAKDAEMKQLQQLAAKLLEEGKQYLIQLEQMLQLQQLTKAENKQSREQLAEAEAKLDDWGKAYGRDTRPARQLSVDNGITILTERPAKPVLCHGCSECQVLDAKESTDD